MTAETVLYTLGAIVAVVTAAAAVRSVFRFLRRLGHVADDWLGEPARDGQPERPGVMRRLHSIESRLTHVEHELRPNGGTSLRDALDRVEVAVTDKPPRE